MKRTILRVAVFAIVTLSLQIVSAQVIQAATPTPAPTSSATPEASPTVAPSETPEATEAVSARVDISDTFISPYVISYTVITDTVSVVAPWRLAGESDVIDTYAAGDIIKSATTHDDYVAVKVEDADEGGQARYVWLPEASLETIEPTVITETVQLARILVNSLNVRSGPGTGYDVVDSMPLNATAEILGEEDGWYRILGDSTDNYISGAAQFVEVVEEDQEAEQPSNPVLAKYADEGAGIIAEIYEQARELFPEVKNIVVDPVKGPEAVDAEGNIVARFLNAGWKMIGETDSHQQLFSEPANEDPEIELIAQAQEVNDQVVLVTVHEGVVYGLSEMGFPLVEKADGEWQAIETISYDRLANSDKEEERRLIEELPSQVVYADENNQIVVHTLTQEDLQQFKFAISGLGEHLSYQITSMQHEDVAEFQDTEIRADWYRKELSSEKAEIYIALSYYDVHPTREIMNDHELGKQYIMDIRWGSLEQILRSQQRIDRNINNQSNVDVLIKFGILDEDEVPERRDVDFDDGEIFNDQIKAFWEYLADFNTDGKVYFPKLEKWADPSKPIKIRISRFPDKKGEKHWWNGRVGAHPSDFYQISEDGQLIVDYTYWIAESWNFSSLTNDAFYFIIHDEFDINPDEWDKSLPIYSTLDDQFVKYSEFTLKDGTIANTTVHAFFLDIAFEKDPEIKPD